MNAPQMGCADRCYPREDMAVLQTRMNALEGAVGKIADAAERIATHTAVLASLESKHSETRAELAALRDEAHALELRLATIETTLPGLNELRTWAVRAMLGGLGLIGLALAKLVIGA